MFLETERLRLREFRHNDWRAIYAYQVDPLYLRYNPWTQRSEKDVRDFLGRFLAWQSERPRRRFQFAIDLKSEKRLIGNCGIRMQQAGASEAEIGYELDSRYWGHGYASEAARALLRFGFEELRLHRIWAHCIAENTASAHVLEKIGMRREGHLHESEWMKGRWWDTFLYAILDHEWRERLHPHPRDAS